MSCSLSLSSRFATPAWRPRTLSTVLAIIAGMTVPASAASVSLSANTDQGQVSDLRGAASVAPARPETLLSGSDVEENAEQIFRSDPVSARSVSAFARNSQPLARTRSGIATMKALFLPSSGGSSDALSDTINAFRTDRPAVATAGDDFAFTNFDAASKSGESLDTFLSFWKDTKSTSSRVEFNDALLDVSVAGASAENVPIPLPPAVWSALSVMGAMGAVAGLRRWRAAGHS